MCERAMPWLPETFRIAPVDLLKVSPDADKLISEARELSAIFSAAYRTAKRNED